MKTERLLKRCGEAHMPSCDWSVIGDENGQDLIEYALLSAVLSVAFVASIQAVGAGFLPFFDAVLSAFRSL